VAAVRDGGLRELWRPVILIAGLFVYAGAGRRGICGCDHGPVGRRPPGLGYEDVVELLVISLALSIGTYILFDRLLDVSLPEGVLAELI
jgi:hypothetical protein